MKIAVLIAIWNRDYFNYMYRGFKQYALTHDVEIHMFVSFGKQGHEKVNDETEYEFFQMPDMDAYDGIIEFGITMMYKKARRKILEKLQKQGKPVISVEAKKPGCSWVGIDQYQAMQDIIRHMVKVHNVHFVGYAGGIQGTYEADLREKAFWDMVQRKNLRTEQEWIFHKSYLYNDGIAIGRKILKAHIQGQEIPEAIICANDEMAEGICDALYDTGLWKRVRITGFDGYFNAERFSPTLTTVMRPKEQVSMECCRLMEELLSGKEKGLVHKALRYQIIFGSSCGCRRRHNMREKDKFHRQSFHREQHKLQMEARLQKMEEHTTSDITQEEILAEFGNVFSEFSCTRCRMYLRENLLSEERVTYRDCKRLVADWSFESKNKRERNLLLYAPIHFQQNVYGYCILETADAMVEYHVLESMFHKMSFSMENFVQKQRYQEINKKYQRLYMTDQLTGLYNRFGLTDLGLKLYEKNRREQKDTLIIFCDINRLKYINDTFGHKAGDWAIRLVGDVLEEQKTESCLPFRYGGDEFILIADAKAERSLTEQIRQRLEERQHEHPQEFYLDISIGSIVASWREAKELEAYFIQADEIMYQEKMKYYQKHFGTQDCVER